MAGLFQKLFTAFRGGLSIGSGGSRRSKVVVGSAAGVNPGSIAATTRAGVTFELEGARAGDGLIVNPPAGLHDDLVFAGAAVTDDDEVTVYLYNPTGGAIDDAALTWTYTWLKQG